MPLASALVGLAAAIIGSLPWWWHNLSQNFNSFAGPLQPSPPGPGGAYWWHLGIFDRYVVPARARSPHSHDGQVDRADDADSASRERLRSSCSLAWLAYAAVRGRGAADVRGCSLLYVAAFPFLYAAQPFSWYWEDGRYAIFLAPAVALMVASLACQLGRWAIGSARFVPAIMAALVLVGGLALTLRAARNMLPYQPERALPGVERTSWSSWHTNPNNLPTGLAASLIRWHVHDAFTGYWLAYDVAFLAQGRVDGESCGSALHPLSALLPRCRCKSRSRVDLRDSSGSAGGGNRSRDRCDRPGVHCPRGAVPGGADDRSVVRPSPHQLPDPLQRTLRRRDPVPSGPAVPDTAGVQHLIGF